MAQRIFGYYPHRSAPLRRSLYWKAIWAIMLHYAVLVVVFLALVASWLLLA